MAAARSAFSAAVFDMDGLLLDTERPVRAAWLGAAAAVGVTLTDADYLTLVGLNHRASHARLLGYFAQDATRLAQAARHAEATLTAEFGSRPFAAKAGARRLLQALHTAGVPCAVASSTHRAEVLRRLGNAGLLGFFGAICGGDEVEHGKPAPDLYTLALKRIDAAAASSLAFEDSGHGAEAALAAGLAVVVVPDLKAPEPAVLARCRAVLPSLDAVAAHSLAWFGIELGSGLAGAS